jgi:hypothetical protein
MARNEVNRLCLVSTVHFVLTSNILAAWRTARLLIKSQVGRSRECPKGWPRLAAGANLAESLAAVRVASTSTRISGIEDVWVLQAQLVFLPVRLRDAARPVGSATV